MARFRVVAGVVVALGLGTLFGLACAPGGVGSAAASEGETGDGDEGVPPPSGTGAGRAVVQLQYGADGTYCYSGSGDSYAGCCPGGFTYAGKSAVGYGVNAPLYVAVCIED